MRWNVTAGFESLRAWLPLSLGNAIVREHSTDETQHYPSFETVFKPVEPTVMHISWKIDNTLISISWFTVRSSALVAYLTVCWSAKPLSLAVMCPAACTATLLAVFYVSSAQERIRGDLKTRMQGIVDSKCLVRPATEP
jgi:hypothetical protein